MRRFYELGVKELNGHLLYALADKRSSASPMAWLERQGILGLVSEAVNTWRENGKDSIDDLFDQVESRFNRRVGGRRRADDLQRCGGRGALVRRYRR